MVRSSKALDAALQPFVRVLVTDMREFDLSVFRFDYGLTFAALLMHADGTVYHRYGSRDARDATTFISEGSFIRVLDITADEHRNWAESSATRTAPKAAAKTTILDSATFAARDAQSRVDCVHCHTIDDFRHHDLVVQGTWSRDRAWQYPAPEQLGLVLDRHEQTRVVDVTVDSIAALAGISPGDQLLELEGTKLATYADLGWALHELGDTAKTAEVRIERPAEAASTAHDGAATQAFATTTKTLHLPAGWRVGTPRDFAWRPQKWHLSPAPGFGGPALTAGEKHELGLSADAFAFRIQYFVDWGRLGHRAKPARNAGLRKGDVIFEYGGRSDFDSIDHWHAWVRLACDPDQEVTVAYLRNGSRSTTTYRLPR